MPRLWSHICHSISLLGSLQCFSANAKTTRRLWLMIPGMQVYHLGTWHLVKSRDRTASSERRTVYELWLKQRRITSQAQMHGHYSLHDITVAPLRLVGRAALRTILGTYLAGGRHSKRAPRDVAVAVTVTVAVDARRRPLCRKSKVRRAQLFPIPYLNPCPARCEKVTGSACRRTSSTLPGTPLSPFLLIPTALLRHLSTVNSGLDHKRAHL